ncbi:MAG: MFS transporter [Polyangiaceae bacterium]
MSSPIRPLSTLRHRPVLVWVLARFGSGAAVTLLRSVFMWQVYAVSHSKVALGLVGLFQFLPAPIASLVGGAVADARDRRRIVLVTQTVSLVCATLLSALTFAGAVTLPVLFALVVAAASASSFESPARSAILPSLVPPEELPAAVTLFGTINALAFMSGPAIGGALLAAGPGVAYGGAALLFLLSWVLVTLIPKPKPRSDAPKRAVDLASIKEGIAFVWKEKALLGCMSLDMFAVLFGGATALLPVFATDILACGSGGYGLLSASLDIGALVTSLVLLARRPIRRLGRALLVTVAVYGVATIAFGLSRSFPLSVAAYVAVGMADQVSVIVRGMIVQTVTPDALRGRVSAVNMLFIGASNQLGAFESGMAAALLGPVAAVVGGGAICLVVVLVVGLALPRLTTFGAPEPEVP